MNFDISFHNVCFLSPHSDDTFLELFYAISHRVLPGEYFFCTIFSKSIYVDISQKEQHPQDCITNLRLGEDASFARKYGLKHLFLDEPDCLLRYGEVFFEDCLLSESLIKDISTKLITKLDEYDIDCLVAPFPYGRKQHYDHRILREVAKRVASEKSICMLWTNDIPYSSVPDSVVKRVLWEKKLTKDQSFQKGLELDILYPSQTCKYYKDAIPNISENLFYL